MFNLVHSKAPLNSGDPDENALVPMWRSFWKKINKLIFFRKGLSPNNFEVIPEIMDINLILFYSFISSEVSAPAPLALLNVKPIHLG